MITNNMLNLLKRNNIELDNGITSDELIEIENIYNIQFPKSMREFLMVTVPISKGFYNWKNTNKNNVDYIKAIMKIPFDNLLISPCDLCWCDDWGTPQLMRKNISWK